MNVRQAAKAPPQAEACPTPRSAFSNCSKSRKRLSTSLPARWTEGRARGMIIRIQGASNVERPMYRLALLILVGATAATTQTVKSETFANPEQPVDRSKALDQFTESVQSRLPPGAPVSERAELHSMTTSRL